MANIIIRITGMGAVGNLSMLSITGEARTDDMKKDDPSVFWETTVSISDLLMNSKIADSAIAAALQAGFVVNVLDMKTIIGGVLRL